MGDRIVGCNYYKAHLKNWSTCSVLNNRRNLKPSCTVRKLQLTDPNLYGNIFYAFERRIGVLSLKCKPGRPSWRLQARATDLASRTPHESKLAAAGNKRPAIQEKDKLRESTKEEKNDNEKDKSMKFMQSVYDLEDWERHRSSTRHFRHLLSIASSRVIQSLGFPVFAVTSIAALVAIFNEIVLTHVFPPWVPLLHVPSLPFQLTAPALALLLVFRTNASYARFDEARKAWGLNLNRSRNFARQALTWIRHPDDLDKLDKLLRLCMAFPFCMKSHLTDEPRLEVELRTLLLKDDVDKILSSPHRPNHVLQTMTEIIFTCSLSDMARALLDRNLTQFHDNLGTCERILETPIPLSYTRMTSRFLFIWHAILPLGLWDQCGWIVIPAIFCSAGALFCIEQVGVLIEEPLGIISLDNICTTIRQDVEGLLQAHFDSLELNKKFFRKGDSTRVSYVKGLRKPGEDPSNGGTK